MIRATSPSACHGAPVVLVDGVVLGTWFAEAGAAPARALAAAQVPIEIEAVVASDGTNRRDGRSDGARWLGGETPWDRGGAGVGAAGDSSSAMSIHTIAELRDHLRIAMRVELSTVPLYLYGLQSIDDPHSDAAGLIRSIVAEEMLHFALVANLLLAVGGEANPADPSLRPVYPSLLLNHTPPLTLNLAPATADQIRSTFLTIEQPDPPGSPVEPGVYDSLGEFYGDIARAIDALARTRRTRCSRIRRPSGSCRTRGSTARSPSTSRRAAT